MVWRARRSDWIAERGRALALLLRRPGDAERVRRGLGARSGPPIRRRRQIPLDRPRPLLPPPGAEGAMSRLPPGPLALVAPPGAPPALGGGGARAPPPHPPHPTH